MKKIKSYLFLLKQVVSVFYYDAKRYIKYSSLLKPYETQNKLLGRIVALYHVVEKGLTMPDMRLGFGIDNLYNLIRSCEAYQTKYDTQHPMFVHAISSILEYEKVHEENKYQLPVELLKNIQTFKNLYPNVIPSEQKRITDEEYFPGTDADFEKFAFSRHSVRNYSTEEVSMADIEKSIALAQTTPTACNRQPIRIHIVQKDKLEDVLLLQNGNRGFGDKANKLIIVTVDLSSYLNIYEHNSAYIDGGIYIMNLLYALHYHQIAACTLNWSVAPPQDKQLRKLLNIKSTENVICILTIGKAASEFKLALSKRLDCKNVITIH